MARVSSPFQCKIFFFFFFLVERDYFPPFLLVWSREEGPGLVAWRTVFFFSRAVVFSFGGCLSVLAGGLWGVAFGGGVLGVFGDGRAPSVAMALGHVFLPFFFS